MTQYSRKHFLLLMASGTAAAAFGCGEEDSGGSSNTSGGATGTGASTSSTGGATSAGGTTSATGGTTSATGGAAGDNGSGGGTGGDDSTVSCEGDNVVALCSPSGGHTHTLEVPVVDVLAGAAETYTSGTTIGHDHEITLTADDMTTLREGGVVRKTTCGPGPHEWVLSCAADPPAPVPPTGC